jgi:A/G-specific adenine glycosylase
VNSFWKGLGYYSRASNLLKAAKKIVQDFDGLIPSDARVMEKEIPGVGRYTAGLEQHTDL